MIGYTSVTYRQLDIQGNVDLAVSAGVECIEWGGDVHVTDIATAKVARLACEAAGIAISAYGSYYRVGSGDYEQWQQVVAIASELNAPVIRVWLGCKGSCKMCCVEIDCLITEGKRMADIAAEHNIIIANECHQNTYTDTTDTLLSFLKAVDKPNYRTYYQSRYLNMSQDIDMLERVLEYVDNVHISYSEVKVNQKGKLFKDKNALDKVVAKLCDMDYQGNIIFEFVAGDDTHQLAKDIARLREQIAHCKG